MVTYLAATKVFTDHEFSGAGIRYVVEAVGTFFLVFTVGAAVGSSSPLAPFGIGVVLMVMIYAGARVPGGHFNPAVTLAMLVRDRIGLREAGGYWLVQLGAGLIAATTVRAIIDPARVATLVEVTLSGRTLLLAFTLEMLFMFALCCAVLDVASRRDQPECSYDGLAIGCTIVAGAVAIGACSAGAFTPSDDSGSALAGILDGQTWWVYLIAQVIGGLAAGVTFLALNPDTTDRRVRPR